MKTSQSEVINPGSFDPVTYGHLDLLKRANDKFAKVIMGVGKNPDKKYMFSLPERVEMIKGALQHELYATLAVDVEAYDGLTVDFAFEKGVQTFVRGMRGSADLEAEMLLYHAGKTQNQVIDTIFLLAKQDQTHVSSSVTKAVLKEQGDITSLVPLNVKHFLEARMMGQYIAGVTGSIGAGKSYVTDQFVQIGTQEHIPVHNIDLDKIGHAILSSAGQPGYQLVRQSIIQTFGPSVANEDGSIDRKALWAIVFNDPKQLATLDEIMKPAMHISIRKAITGKKGVILLNGALLAEAWLAPFVNNNVVVVDVDPALQVTRLQGRGHADEHITARIQSQRTAKQKEQVFNDAIKQTGTGTLTPLLNNDADQATLKRTFDQMLCSIDIFGELRIKSHFEKMGCGEHWLSVYTDLKKMHDGAERHYHNWFHIIASLNQLYAIRDQLSEEDFSALFFAILFHDAIYSDTAKPGENEANSAALATHVMTKLMRPKAFIDKVVRLINLTAGHTVDTTDLLWAYMADIDLSVLGNKWKHYSNYATSIRKEYGIYDDPSYLAGRKKFLTDTLTKSETTPLYRTPYYQQHFEHQAKENMAMELSMIDVFCQRNNTVLYREAL